MARPKIYTDKTRIHIQSEKAKAKLQQGSDRRAIVNVIVENGGSMTLAQLDKHFGFNIKGAVMTLIRSKWLSSDAEVKQ